MEGIGNSGITLCLLFDGQAQAAANFYVETFRACGQPAEIRKVARVGDSGPGPKDSVLTAIFTIAGQEVLALNGPRFSFTPATSLMVHCADQAEIDRFWEKLSDAAPLANAAGSPTASASPGRLCPPPSRP